ncbi:MAG: hypothetical protein GSR81_05570 [Desulfurococcales archaeon]|nr:hypothetical protein [Desulfurococcales archaeon]
MVSQEEIRRIRIENMKKTGALELQAARAEAIKQGINPQQIAAIITDYYTGKLPAKKAAEKLRSLIKRNGRGR